MSEQVSSQTFARGRILNEPVPWNWADVRTGFVATLPIWLGAFPFAIAYAIAARTAGLDTWQTLGMSAIVFAGAAQLTSTGLFAAGANPVSIVLTTLIVNLRHLLLTASLVTPLRRMSWLWRAVLAFGVTDESYVISVRQLVNGEASAALLLGSNVSLYVMWQASTLLGVLLGGVLPDPQRLGLEIVFPLSFLVLLMPYMRSRAAWAAALVGGMVAVIAMLVLPGSWYILLAAIAGSVAGALVEER